MDGPILFFDGVCGLCDRLVQFVLRRDRGRAFRFAALQSPFAAETLRRYGKNAAELDTLYVVDREGQLRHKGRAVLFVLRTLGWPWRLFTVAALLPTPLLDWFYDRVARSRYRIFGKREACRIPTADEKLRFLGWSWEGTRLCRRTG